MIEITNIHAMRELWQHENKLNNMQRNMKLWDKKLSNLDDEMLYYVFMRASSIIEHRQQKESTNNSIRPERI